MKFLRSQLKIFFKQVPNKQQAVRCFPDILAVQKATESRSPFRVKEPLNIRSWLISRF
jgi:hypothetical protein